jgi:hypothetical protein
VGDKQQREDALDRRSYPSQIMIPETVANVGFAEDGKTVYLTGWTSLYRYSAIPGEISLYYKR